MTQSGASSVPILVSKVQSVYGFLLEEDSLAIHNIMRDTLALLAYVIRHCTFHQGLFGNKKLLYVAPIIPLAMF